jgi:hypothetical protein
MAEKHGIDGKVPFLAQDDPVAASILLNCPYTVHIGNCLIFRKCQFQIIPKFIQYVFVQNSKNLEYQTRQGFEGRSFTMCPGAGCHLTRES